MNSPSEYLLYRRQFILGTRLCRPTAHWRHLQLDGGLVLSFHPDLNVERVAEGDRSLVLLGYILDPFNPEFTDRDILEELLTVPDFALFLNRLSPYGGRWIVLWIDGTDTILVHDPLGSREVYYAWHAGHCWCASQPHVLAQSLGLSKRCDTALTGFMQSEMFRDSERAWVGSHTPYEGVDHLLPNHYLDIIDGAVWRYWPGTPRHAAAREKVVPQVCRILQGILEAASHRFELALAVSAGWDSRVLLAASRAVSDRITYFIQQFGKMTDEHLDIRTPRRLMNHLNRSFTVSRVKGAVNPTFEKLFEASAAMYHSEEKKRLHYNFFTQMSEKVFVNGMTGCRSSFVSRNGAGKTDMVQEFINKSVANPFSVRASKSYAADEAWITAELQEWYEEIVPVVDGTGYDAMDLLYCEQRQGNWGAMYCSSGDIAGEILLPYSCRLLQELVLSVDEKYRCDPHYTVFRNMATHMWPATLQQPVNGIPVRTVRRAYYDLKSLRTKNSLRRMAGHVVAHTPSPLLAAYRKMKNGWKNSVT